MTRWTATPSWKVAGSPVAGRPSRTPTKSRINRTHERAHMLSGTVCPDNSSGTLTSSSATPGRPTSSFVPPTPGRLEGLRSPVAAQVGHRELEMQHRADRAGADQFSRPAPVRLIAQLVVDAGAARAPLGHLDHALRLTRGERHRLLAQHVLAGLEGRDGVARVGVRGRRHEDEVDVAAAGQLLAAPERVRNIELPGHGCRPRAIPARHRRHHRPWHQPQPRQLHPSREPRADDTDSDRHGCTAHGSVSAPIRTDSNDASSVTRAVPATSLPEPRALAASVSPARITDTVPLSRVTPCATSPTMKRAATTAPRSVVLSPRASSGNSPLATESFERRWMSTPLPRSLPCSNRPRRPG